LQRGETKLDREGRDYWIKPLRDLGAIEPAYLDAKTRTFLPGHPVAKSPNSAYRLSATFKDVLLAPDQSVERQLRHWASETEVRKRVEFQARVEKDAAAQVTTKHSDLIRACVQHYVPAFLPGYEVVYVDETDGERVTDEDRRTLTNAGIEITLADAMPDVLLWNRSTDSLWVIEAVTSDGEVDNHKVQQMNKLAERSGKQGIEFTTAYESWKVVAARQKKYRNVAPGTYIWIQEDAAKHFLAESFPWSP